MALFGTNLPTAFGNAVGSATARVQEAATQAVATFAQNLPFKKVAARAPTVQEAAGQLQRGRAALDSLINNPMTQAELIRQRLNASAKVSATTLSSQLPQSETDHFVQLKQIGINETRFVRFEVMPEITESRSIEYDAVAPAQAPGAFQKYKGTSAVQWQVNATLISRTTDEATANLQIINQLRGWTMPYFGDKILRQFPQRLGAPPPVLEFSGFRKRMVGPVPVVITSLNWTFPKDVDYIPARDEKPAGNAGTGSSSSKLIPFPTVMIVALQLVETFTANQMNNFSLADYIAGDFGNAYTELSQNSSSQVNSAAAAGGGAEEPEEAQIVARNSVFSPSTDTDAAENQAFAFTGAGNGRSLGIGGPTREELENFGRKQVPVNEVRTKVNPVITGSNRFESDNDARFESGGGDFGGGDPSGDF